MHTVPTLLFIFHPVLKKYLQFVMCVFILTSTYVNILGIEYF